MMTVISRVVLREGAGPEWDAAMRERLEMAKTKRGWVAAQLLMPLDSLNQRLIVGTWRTRADWEAWHEDQGFVETRKRLAGMEERPHEISWHEVVADPREEGPQD